MRGWKNWSWLRFCHYLARVSIPQLSNAEAGNWQPCRCSLEPVKQNVEKQNAVEEKSEQEFNSLTLPFFDDTNYDCFVATKVWFKIVSKVLYLVVLSRDSNCQDVVQGMDDSVKIPLVGKLIRIGMVHEIKIECGCG